MRKRISQKLTSNEIIAIGKREQEKVSRKKTAFNEYVISFMKEHSLTRQEAYVFARKELANKIRESKFNIIQKDIQAEFRKLESSIS